jgi:hypothetical protein
MNRLQAMIRRGLRTRCLDEPMVGWHNPEAVHPLTGEPVAPEQKSASPSNFGFQRTITTNSAITCYPEMNWARDNAGLSEDDLAKVFRYAPTDSTVIRMLESRGVCLCCLDEAVNIC